MKIKIPILKELTLTDEMINKISDSIKKEIDFFVAHKDPFYDELGYPYYIKNNHGSLCLTCNSNFPNLLNNFIFCWKCSVKDITNE